jgi:hypothetical protein
MAGAFGPSLEGVPQEIPLRKIESGLDFVRITQSRQSDVNAGKRCRFPSIPHSLDHFSRFILYFSPQLREKTHLIDIFGIEAVTGRSASKEEGEFRNSVRRCEFLVLFHPPEIGSINGPHQGLRRFPDKCPIRV